MPKKIEQALRDEIHRVLQNAGSDNAPNVLKAIQTKEGYRTIEAKIIRMVIEERLTPSACIPHLEQML